MVPERFKLTAERYINVQKGHRKLCKGQTNPKSYELTIQRLQKKNILENRWKSDR